MCHHKQQKTLRLIIVITSIDIIGKWTLVRTNRTWTMDKCSGLYSNPIANDELYSNPIPKKKSQVCISKCESRNKGWSRGWMKSRGKCQSKLNANKYGSKWRPRVLRKIKRQGGCGGKQSEIVQTGT